MKKLFCVRKKKDYNHYYIIALDHRDALEKAEEYFYGLNSKITSSVIGANGDLLLPSNDQDDFQIGTIELISDNIIF